MNHVLRIYFRRAAILWVFSLLLSVSWGQNVQIQVGRNFNGSDNISTGITPADGDGAIGPAHYVEFINGFFAIYAKTNGQLLSRISDSVFWANAGVTLAFGTEISDPRVIYDPASQRWFASQVDFDGTAGDPAALENDFLIAVSDSADPTGGWHGVSFISDPDNFYFADFPTIGLDTNAFYISGDMFADSSTPVGVSLWSIPKADLLINTTPAVITNATFYGVMDFADRGEILQPATCVDGSSSGDVLAAASIFVGSTLIASQVLNGDTANATLADATKISVESYSFPFDPMQPDGTDRLADNDSRMGARVYTVGGVIFAVQNIEVNNRAAIRWYRIAATDHTLLESGTITDPDLDLFYPSITANIGGIIMIGCNGSSIHQPVSSFAYAGLTVNGVTTFNGPKLLQGGTIGNYHDGNELSGAQESRWGDYSATTPDPSDPSRFWTVQMIPLTSRNWATRITEILAVPQLSIVSTATNVNLSWPLFAVNYQLQSSTNLTGAWLPVVQTASTNSNQLTVTVARSGAQQFFRLAEPQ